MKINNMDDFIEYLEQKSDEELVEEMISYGIKVTKKYFDNVFPEVIIYKEETEEYVKKFDFNTDCLNNFSLVKDKKAA